ncbi:MAG: nitroreductase family protein [Acidimicrobiales bacterium]|nr:nitroreductase family protein [Acidimicrobiales bacterium]
MELRDALAQRHMVRSFSTEPIAPEALGAVLDAATRSPSAGNSQGLDLVVLEGPDRTARYWDVTLPASRRAGFRWQGLLRAPVLVVVAADPDRYVARYGEPDKAGPGLGEERRAWTVPFWHVDAGMAVMAMLLRATDLGLGALFFGIFEHAAAVASALGVPEDRELVGTVALGHPDPNLAATEGHGRSADRPRRTDQIHHGTW